MPHSLSDIQAHGDANIAREIHLKVSITREIKFTMTHNITILYDIWFTYTSLHGRPIKFSFYYSFHYF